MRKITAIFLIIIVTLCIPVYGQRRKANNDLSWEQQQTLKQWFARNNEFVGLNKQIIDKFLSDDHRFKKFLGDYADALVAVGVMNNLANAEDYAALETISLFATGKAMGKYFPSMSKALGWFSWAKTGMQVFKDFVFDPYLIRTQINQYSNRRRALEPKDAIVNVRAIGNIKPQMLAEYRKQHGDSVFQEISPSGLRLLPRWERKFDKFMLAYFENQHQFKKLKAKQRALRKTVESQHNKIADKLALMAERYEREQKAGNNNNRENSNSNTLLTNKEGYIVCPKTPMPLLKSYTGSNYEPGKITFNLQGEYYATCGYNRVGSTMIAWLSVSWIKKTGMPCKDTSHSRWDYYVAPEGNATVHIPPPSRFSASLRNAAIKHMLLQIKPLTIPCKRR